MLPSLVTNSVLPYLLLSIITCFVGFKIVWQPNESTCTISNHPIKLALRGCIKINPKEFPKIMKMYWKLCPLGYRHCDIVPPFVPFPAHFTIASKYKLNNCVLRKNMSTVLNAIICYLTKPDYFIKHGKHLLTEGTEGRSCENENELITQVNESEKWRNIVFIRDPIERFLSGFANQCRKRSDPGQCYGCVDNMDCVVHNQHLTDLEWLGYHGRESEAHVHLSPQNWQCEFRETFDLYQKIKYNSSQPESAFDDLRSVLREQNVPENHLDRIFGEIYSARTSHATIKNPHLQFFRKALFSSPKMMRSLLKQYFFDYILFEYDFPEF